MPRVDANSINLTSEAGGSLIDEHQMFVSLPLEWIMGFPSTSSPLVGSARTVWHTCNPTRSRFFFARDPSEGTLSILLGFQPLISSAHLGVEWQPVASSPDGHGAKQFHLPTKLIMIPEDRGARWRRVLELPNLLDCRIVTLTAPCRRESITGFVPYLITGFFS